jgi:hypothetical protein
VPLSAVFRFPSTVLIALNWGNFTLSGPPPVTMRSCSAPMILTAPKHHNPSEITWAVGASELAANSATASVVNGCLAKHAYCG